MTMRTDDSFLSIGLVSFLRNGNLQPRSVPWSRFHNHVSSYRTNPLLDDGRPPAYCIQFGQGQTSGKRESFSVIINHQLPQTILRAEADHGRLRPTVLADIHQALLHDTHQFATGARWTRHFLQL